MAAQLLFVSSNSGLFLIIEITAPVLVRIINQDKCYDANKRNRNLPSTVCRWLTLSMDVYSYSLRLVILSYMAYLLPTLRRKRYESVRYKGKPQTGILQERNALKKNKKKCSRHMARLLKYNYSI